MLDDSLVATEAFLDPLIHNKIIKKNQKSIVYNDKNLLCRYSSVYICMPIYCITISRMLWLEVPRRSLNKLMERMFHALHQKFSHYNTKLSASRHSPRSSFLIVEVELGLITLTSKKIHFARLIETTCPNFWSCLVTRKC